MSMFWSTTFGDRVLSKLGRYKKENYTRLNFQNCINLALSMKMCDQFKTSQNLKANKYDIDSAFISCLTHNEFLLPTTIIPSDVLVNTDANNFFKNLKEDDLNFGFVKLFCIPKKNGYLPFFPYYSVKNGIQYTCCSLCCDSNQDIENCNHSESERGYFVKTYLTDALFKKKNVRKNKNRPNNVF